MMYHPKYYSFQIDLSYIIMWVCENLTKHSSLCSHYEESTSKILKIFHNQEIVLEAIIISEISQRHETFVFPNDT